MIYSFYSLLEDFVHLYWLFSFLIDKKKKVYLKVKENLDQKWNVTLFIRQCLWMSYEQDKISYFLFILWWLM